MTDDNTPHERPRTVVEPVNRALCLVLANHAIVLADTAKSIERLKERIEKRDNPPTSPELEELAKAFRAEGDSAHAVARAIELDARGRARPGP